jgi:hypothetical protein
MLRLSVACGPTRYQVLAYFADGFWESVRTAISSPKRFPSRFYFAKQDYRFDPERAREGEFAAFDHRSVLEVNLASVDLLSTLSKFARITE